MGHPAPRFRNGKGWATREDHRSRRLNMIDSRDIETMETLLVGSPWMANLTAALERKTNVALILGKVDHCDTIRDHLGHVSLDHVFPIIDKIFQERFENYARMGAILPYFLILLTGDDAEKAAAIAESIRGAVERTAFDERFNVTMHFGVTHASLNGFHGLVRTADTAIEVGKRKLVANRVYEPATMRTYWDTIAKVQNTSEQEGSHQGSTRRTVHKDQRDLQWEDGDGEP
jgi:GGDEF domain-containing protein